MSFVGNGAAQIALLAMIYDRTGSSTWVAGGLVATHGVTVFAGLFASSVSDRVDRRKVMITSELAGAACYLAMAATSRLDVLLVMAVVASLMASPFNSASGAAIPNLVDSDRLGWANSLLSSGRNLGLTIGPALGGLLVAWVGARAVFALDGVSFLLSAALISTVTGRFSSDRGTGHSEGGVQAGLVFLWRDRVLRLLMTAEVVLVVGLGLVQVARVPLSRTLHVGSSGLGLMAGLWGAGLVAGSIAGRRLTEGNEAAVFMSGLVGVAAASLAIGVIPWFVPILALHALVGFADSLDLIAGLSMRQRRTPDHVMSRVLAANSSMVVVAQMAGYGAAGIVMTWVGPQAVYVLCAAAVAVSAVICAPVLRLARAGSGPGAREADATASSPPGPPPPVPGPRRSRS